MAKLYINKPQIIKDVKEETLPNIYDIFQQLCQQVMENFIQKT